MRISCKAYVGNLKKNYKIGAAADQKVRRRRFQPKNAPAPTPQQLVWVVVWLYNSWWWWLPNDLLVLGTTSSEAVASIKACRLLPAHNDVLI